MELGKAKCKTCACCSRKFIESTKFYRGLCLPCYNKGQREKYASDQSYRDVIRKREKLKRRNTKRKTDAYDNELILIRKRVNTMERILNDITLYLFENEY